MQTTFHDKRTNKGSKAMWNSINIASHDREWTEMSKLQQKQKTV